MKKKLSILIPVYNEEKTIHLILNKIRVLNLIDDILFELIIVDDCSKDDTRNVLSKYV